MTIAYWCVLAAIFLPYLATSLAKFQGGFGPNRTTTRANSWKPWKAAASGPLGAADRF